MLSSLRTMNVNNDFLNTLSFPFLRKKGSRVFPSQTLEHGALTLGPHQELNSKGL